MVLATLIIILLVGGLAALLSERISETLPRNVALSVVLLDLLYFLVALSALDKTQLSMVPDPLVHSTWLLHYRIDWIPAFGISIELAMDGISLLMVLLTLILGAVAVSASWTDVTHRRGFFEANLLWSLAGVVGVFLALDLFLFFLFWEVMLVPMYFLIAIWGHENRGYAAMKFFIFTQASGLLMLLAILVLAAIYAGDSGHWSFSYFDLLTTDLGASTAYWLMLGFFVAFVVKLPGFPFHTWLPDAHVEAPTAGSVILAGVLLKMGTYGFVRFSLPLLPDATVKAVGWVGVLSVIAIVYGALVAMAQKDMKKLVAYSSVSHMGFITLGMFALNTAGLRGSILQMLNHGISTGALFLLVGLVYERRHNRMIAEYGGLAKVMPLYATFFLVITMSSIGLPTLNGFIGEFTILIGAFNHSWVWALFAASGIVLGAGYMLWMYQRVFFGELTNEKNKDLKDLNLREQWTLIPLVIIAFWIGLYPKPFFDRMAPTVDRVLERVAVAMPEAETAADHVAAVASPPAGEVSGESGEQ
jgi:NADH-quinone oxidoreductase subunit M